MPDIKSLKKAMELLQTHLDSYEGQDGHDESNAEEDGKVDGEYSDASEYHGKDEFAVSPEMDDHSDGEDSADMEYSKKPLRQKRAGMF